MKPYHINKKQILIMGCLGMFPLFSSAQDILSTSGTSRWDCLLYTSDAADE